MGYPAGFEGRDAVAESVRIVIAAQAQVTEVRERQIVRRVALLFPTRSRQAIHGNAAELAPGFLERAAHGERDAGHGVEFGQREVHAIDRQSCTEVVVPGVGKGLAFVVQRGAALHAGVVARCGDARGCGLHGGALDRERCARAEPHEAKVTRARGGELELVLDQPRGACGEVRDGATRDAAPAVQVVAGFDEQRAGECSGRIRPRDAQAADVGLECATVQDVAGDRRGGCALRDRGQVHGSATGFDLHAHGFDGARSIAAQCKQRQRCERCRRPGKLPDEPQFMGHALAARIEHANVAVVRARELRVHILGQLQAIGARLAAQRQHGPAVGEILRCQRCVCGERGVYSAEREGGAGRENVQSRHVGVPGLWGAAADSSSFGGGSGEK